mmetsp:Transcript_37448/g.36021  ORF Transcript_37448/g.36021 Transcript_37448/m.36021 type:complete len:86 (-) Transcript_37448:656-913(-)
MNGSHSQIIEVDQGNLIQSASSLYQSQEVNSSRHIRGVLDIKELKANKSIGLNPFAGVYLNRLQCLACPNNQELRRFEVFYDLNL